MPHGEWVDPLPYFNNGGIYELESNRKNKY